MVAPRFQKSAVGNPPTGHSQGELWNKHGLNKPPLKRIVNPERFEFPWSQGGAFHSGTSLVKIRTEYQACNV